MKKILKNSLICSGVTIGSLGIGAGATIGVILPKALQAKDALSSFVSSGGASKLAARYAKNKKLKVVALGDSVTAGYNGYTGKDYYSYADFLVKSLEEVTGKGKISYKNYAKSGLRLADIKVKLESGEASRQLRDADIIPITIGANDILAVLKMFHMPFQMTPYVLSTDSDPKNTITLAMDPKTGHKSTGSDYSQTLYEKVNNNFLKAGSSPSENILRNSYNSAAKFLKVDARHMFNETIKDFMEVMHGDSEQYLTLDRGWVDTVFDLVKREIATLTRDLHKAAPNAQIILVGPSLPFTQFPEDVLFKPNPNLHNMNLMEAFNKLLVSMKEGSESTMGGANEFVDFYKADELEMFQPYAWKLAKIASKQKEIKAAYNEIKATHKKDDKKKLEKKLESIFNTLKGERFKKVDYTSEDTYKTSVKENPQPNIMDIHPTIFGHQLIGNSLFKKVAKDLGFNDADIKKGIDAAKTVANDPSNNLLFERIDEDDTILKKEYAKSSSFNTMLSSLKLLPVIAFEKINKAFKAEMKEFDPSKPNGDSKKITTNKWLYKNGEYYANVFFDNLEAGIIEYAGLTIDEYRRKAHAYKINSMITVNVNDVVQEYVMTGKASQSLKKKHVNDLPNGSSILGMNKQISQYVASLYYLDKGTDKNGNPLTESELSNWAVSGISSFFQMIQNTGIIIKNVQPLLTAFLAKTKDK